MNMVDLAREERIMKYDRLISEFEEISNKEKIRRLASSQKSGVDKFLVKDKSSFKVGELAGQLLAELEIFLDKVK